MPGELRMPPEFRGSFRMDLQARALYSEGAGPFRIVPAAVALPKDRADIVALIRYAADAGVSLTPRGAGTGMPGHNVGRGIIVDLAALDRPARIALAGTANVGAAVVCGTVNKIGAHFGLRLAPDPSSAAWCTIGGMIGANASGARSFSRGSIRRWVRGVEFVTAEGEVGWLPRSGAQRVHRFPTPVERRELAEHLAVEDRLAALQPALDAAGPDIDARFPATRKNTAGYALDAYRASGEIVDLVIGSEGTLGFITRAELQLERMPAAVGTLVLALADLQSLAGVVETFHRFEPVALELLDRTFLDLASEAAAPFPLAGVRALILADFEGLNPALVEAALTGAAHAVREAALHTRTALAAHEREQLWRIRHAASPALAALPDDRRSLQVIEDGCVPVAALGRYIAGVEAAAAEAGIPVVLFGHAGDGHLHVNALADTRLPDLERRLSQLLEAVTRLVADLGGTPSGEHGDGRLRAPLLGSIYGPALTSLFADVKRAFDPAGIFNPGVIVPDGRAPLADLKVGPAAAMIPEPIARALRDRERGGRWDRPPLSLLDDHP
jgi:FAD/FMN-containing dehydrogenase